VISDVTALTGLTNPSANTHLASMPSRAATVSVFRMTSVETFFSDCLDDSDKISDELYAISEFGLNFANAAVNPPVVIHFHREGYITKEKLHVNSTCPVIDECESVYNK
jgi:hypothetical protein